MQKEVSILVVCVHEGIRATILRLINNSSEPWQATGAESAEEAEALSRRQSFDAVLLGNGLTEQEELQLSQTIIAQNHQAKIIKHYGGGSGLLFGEIHQALSL